MTKAPNSDIIVRMIKNLSVLFFLVSVLLTLHGSTITEISNVEWTGSGESDGWTYENLDDRYSDGAVKFDRGGAKISSPTFPGDIVKIEVDVKSSNSEPERKLQLKLFCGTELKNSLTLTPTPKTESNGYQQFEISGDLDIDNFQLVLGDGKSGNWGLYSIRIETVENKVLGAYTQKIGSSYLIAAWTNAEAVVSNEVVLATLSEIPLSVDYSVKFDFSSITNKSGNTSSVLDSVKEKFPALDGSEINAPGHAGGYIMLGKYNKFGMLSLTSTISNQGKSLVLELERFNEDDEGWILPIYYANGNVTNDLGTISLEKTPQRKLYSLSLDNVPSESTLIVHSVTNKATASRANARTIVYSLGIADSIIMPHSRTNIVFRHLPVGNERIRIGGLNPESEYFWSVRGFDAEGGSSKFTEPVKAKTEPRIGFGLSIK